jgi:hypothetical protein
MLTSLSFFSLNRSEFGFLMGYFFLCDRTDFFASATKVLFSCFCYYVSHLYLEFICRSNFLLDSLFVQVYNRDLFWFLYFLLIIVWGIPSLKMHHDKSPMSGKTTLYLNRHQTEEWKGWMQVGDHLFQVIFLHQSPPYICFSN